MVVMGITMRNIGMFLSLEVTVILIFIFNRFNIRVQANLKS